MVDSDAFFTLTIVGAPFSVPLGRRVTGARPRPEGLEVPLDGKVVRFSQGWRDHALMSPVSLVSGRHRQPSRLRRWVERQALIFAVLGWATAAATAAWSVWRIHA